MSMKKFLSCGMVSLMLLTGCSCTKKSNNGGNSNVNNNVPGEPTEQNPVVVNNELLNKDGQVESFGYEISGITYDGNMTTMNVTVTNLTDQVQNLAWIIANVTFLDGDVQRNIELYIYVGESLQPNESRTTTTSADSDLRNTTNVTYTVMR